MDIGTLRRIIRQESPARIEVGTVISVDYRGIRQVTVRLSGGRTTSRLRVCPDDLEIGDLVIVAHLEGLDRVVIIGRVQDDYSSKLSKQGILAPPANLEAIGLPMAVCCEWESYPGEDTPYVVEESNDAGATTTQILVTRGSYYLHLCTAEEDHSPETWYFRVRAMRWLGDSNVQYSSWSDWVYATSKTWDARYYCEDELSSAGCDGQHGASLIWICDAADNFVPEVSNVELALAYLAVSGGGNHNDLAGLQGGQAGEYYHFTTAQHTALGTMVTVGLDALTATEVDQLGNIDPVTISNAQWGYLGAADQGTASGDSPMFADVYVPDGGTFGIAGNELLTVNAAADTFAFSGIVGVSVEDGDWVGNSAATARLGFDSSGATDYAYVMGANFGVGTITPGSQISMYGTGDCLAGTRRHNAANAGATFILERSRDVAGADAIIQDDDWILRFLGRAHDGTDFANEVADIVFAIDGAPGANDTPGRIEFRTTKDGQNWPTFAGVVTSAQRWGFGTQTPTHLVQISGTGGVLDLESDSAEAWLDFSPDGGTRAWAMGHDAGIIANGFFLYDSVAAKTPFKVYPGSVDDTLVLRGGNAGVGVTTLLAKLHVDQSSATGAIPVMLWDQADLSEEFLELTTTVGAGNPIDTAAIGGYYGKMRVKVTGVAGYKYIALYN